MTSSWPTLPTTTDPLRSVESLKITLKSERFKEFQIFPNETLTTYGTTVLNSLSITESIFTPLVTGNLIVNDTGNFVENLHIQGFEDIIIEYKKSGDTVKFNGIIIDVNLLTNDGVLSTQMNKLQRNRSYSLSFMNKDLFLANFKNILEIPEPVQNKEPPFKFTSKDFIGWISKLEN